MAACLNPSANARVIKLPKYEGFLSCSQLVSVFHNASISPSLLSSRSLLNAAGSRYQSFNLAIQQAFCNYFIRVLMGYRNFVIDTVYETQEEWQSNKEQSYCFDKVSPPLSGFSSGIDPCLWENKHYIYIYICVSYLSFNLRLIPLLTRD